MEPALPSVSLTAHCAALASLASPASLALSANSLTSLPSGSDTSVTLNGLRVLSCPAVPKPPATSAIVRAATTHHPLRFMGTSWGSPERGMGPPVWANPVAPIVAIADLSATVLLGKGGKEGA